jgi:hypothetical protein
MKAWPPSWRSVVPNIPELKGSFRRAFDAGLLGLYLGAHRDQRAGGRTPRTRYRSLVDEGHRTSARAAVRGDQHLVLVTGRGAGRGLAACADDPQRPRRRCRRTRRSGRARVPFRTRWARRARRTGIALFARWTCDAGFPFGPGLPWPQLANPRASAMRSAIFLDLSMTVLDPAARPCAVAGCGARHAVQSMRDAERRPRRGFHRGQRSHGLLGGSGAFRKRHRIMVRRAVWFPPSSSRRNAQQQHDVPRGWIARLRSSIEALRSFSS